MMCTTQMVNDNATPHSISNNSSINTKYWLTLRIRSLTYFALPFVNNRHSTTLWCRWYNPSFNRSSFTNSYTNIWPLILFGWHHFNISFTNDILELIIIGSYDHHLTVLCYATLKQLSCMCVHFTVTVNVKHNTYRNGIDDYCFSGWLENKVFHGKDILMFPLAGGSHLYLIKH